MQTSPTDSFVSAFFCRQVGLALLTLLASLSLADASDARPEGPSAAIPFSQIGAKATADYQGDALAVVATPEGARLRCAFQKLEGQATAEGLWLESTAPGSGKLRLVAQAVGREGSVEDAGYWEAAFPSPQPSPLGRGCRAVQLSKSPSASDSPTDWRRFPLSTAEGERAGVRGPLQPTGTVAVDDKLVRFIRPGLVEEYSVSVDGVRQDFVLSERLALLRGCYGGQAGEGELRVELALSGARAEARGYGAKLRLEGSGRALAYSRLRAVDATGKELTARLEVVSADRLMVRVEDGDATYPVRIDPTFSDADWISMGVLPGVDDWVNAAVVDDSGNLYIAGDFVVVGDVIANGMAKWDGNAWSAVGSGIGYRVNALAVSGTNLYAGGTFTTAGGTAVTNIAKWDGNAWSALGSGVSGPVAALAVSGPYLYAGGRFTNAGGIAANRIAKWDGNAWSALGLGVGGAEDAWSVSALTVSGSDVYAGGYFWSAGGAEATNIAKWNGSAWSALGSGMSAYGDVSALAVSGTDLYAGGSFTTAGGTAAKRIARWDGNGWSALGSGMNDYVSELAASGTNLYAAGSFTTAGEVAANRIAKWNGSTWSALGSGLNNTVSTLAASGTNLYAGGIFDSAGGAVANAIAKWDGSAWSALGSAWKLGLNGQLDLYVNALAVAGTDLYVGGYFKRAGETTVNNIAKWDGTAWSALGSGVSREVNALAVSGGALYVGGDFGTAGGALANNIAKWDGSAWSALGSGVNHAVYALAVSGDDLYAGGLFTTAGGSAAYRIAKWNRSAWSALGSGLSSWVNALAVSGTDLYAGGSFTYATNAGPSAVYVTRIAKWDGSIWSALGSGIPYNSVDALAVSGTDLYAGGNFRTAGGVPANYIAKWDGNAWSALGSGMSSFVEALAVSGTDLYAGGWFTTAGGTPANRIAKWDGNAWSALGSGVGGAEVSPYLFALAVSGTDLYAGGAFTTAGSKVSANVAKANLAIPPSVPPHFQNWRFTAGRFGCDLDGAAGRKLLLQASTDLKHWVTLRACQLTNTPLGFIDPESPLYPKRFYRLMGAEGVALLEQPCWQAGQFNLNLVGELGRTVLLEASTNLVNWTALATNLLGESPFCFSDSGSTNFPARFYRARLQ